MTLRDLTKRQLYNLRRRMEKERKLWEKSSRIYTPEFRFKDDPHAVWKHAYNHGVKAGLGFVK